MRMLCEYAGVTYTDAQYDDFTEWFQKAKPPLAALNPLVNLPYVKDGDVVISQSNSCFQYLGTKFGLDSKDPLSKEYLSNSQILNEVFDLRNHMVHLVYAFFNVTRTPEEFDVNKFTHLDTTAPKSYAKLEAHLSKAGTLYFSGSHPMSADFAAWEMLDQHERLAAACRRPSPLEPFSKLAAFYAAIRALPQLAKYFESDAFRLPINNPLAKAYFL